jgi:hypothetical protein
MTRTIAILFSLSILGCTKETTTTRPAQAGAPSSTPSSTTQAPAEAGSSSPALPAVKGPKLMPVDEGSKDASFAAFRNDLLGAVRSRDVDAVVKALDPKIRTDFGGGGGMADFRRHWKLDQPDSPLWAELEQILTRGGTFQTSGEIPRFWAPYVYSAWPDDVDAFQHVAVIEKDVPLRRSAGQSATAVASLSYDIVERVGQFAPNEPWQEVKTLDGRTGWVESRLVRSPIGYRAGFAKKNGRWWMEALVAGD